MGIPLKGLEKVRGVKNRRIEAVPSGNAKRKKIPDTGVRCAKLGASTKRRGGRKQDVRQGARLPPVT